MNLSNYITTLLYRYECVIVPGFGAFITRVEPARIRNGVFFPPSKQLSFNSQLQVNDGLLAGHIARVEKVSYEVALQQLRLEVAGIKELLENKKQFSIKEVGMFTRDFAGRVLFQPDTSINYLTAAFGFSSFDFNPASRENIEESDGVTVRRTAPYWRYAAVGLLVAGLVGFGKVYLDSRKTAAYNLAEKHKANQQIENKIQQATFSITDPLPAVTFSVKKPLGPYHLVAGAFRIAENAESHIEFLKNKGYSARLLGVNKYGLHQVVYGSYAHKEEALRVLKQIQTSENPDAWLLVQEIE